MWKYEPVHKAFDKCAADHINSPDVRQKLYREGLTSEMFAAQLEEIVLPVYNAALNLGFSRWSL